MKILLNRTSQVVIDLVVLSVALSLAHMLRFDGDPPEIYTHRLLVLWPYIVALQYGALVVFGVHRYQWRYVGLREMTRIFAALGFAAAVLFGARVLSAGLAPRVPALEHVHLPLGINLIGFTVAFLGIAGVRALRRMLAEHQDALRRRAVSQVGAPEPTILIGAGQVGRMVAKEILGRPELGLRPVGFLDDDLEKVGTTVHGLRVLGPTRELPALCHKLGLRHALIAIASASGRDIRRLAELCRQQALTTKIVPGIAEIVGGAVSFSRMRDVQIEDLLGREPIELDASALDGQLGGKVIVVTGAGGSIGSELCRQVCRFGPARLILAEQAENALFDVHRELEASYPDVALVPLVVDVCDERRVRWLMETHRPAVVFHAAAHKHVPMMEWNPGEAIKNNLFGTKVVADEADRAGVGAFVMISTDKAVNPTSVMGASKRAAEIYAQLLARRSGTRFVTVRFGNVLGSAGSVVPLFREQIARGGPVRVTHPEMKRYFMTIPEACQLVLQAGTMGEGGEIFILDMGEPVKIVDLARDMIKLSGFTPGDDIEIQFTGTRPGEKLFEELAVLGENADKTRHPKIYVGRGRVYTFESVMDGIERLREAARAGSDVAVRAALVKLIPEYTPELPAALPEVVAAEGSEPRAVEEKARRRTSGKIRLVTPPAGTPVLG